MQWAWQLARNSLTGRRGRTVLMIGAVALAASLVVAVSSAIGSAQASLEQQLLKFLGASDARVIHPGGGRFDADVLETVRTRPVELATGRVEGAVTLVRADGAVDDETGRGRRSTPRAIGVDFALEPSFRVLDLEAGRWPESPDEVLLDPQTASALDATVGTALQIQRLGPPIDLTVAGIYARRRLGALQRPRIYIDRLRLEEATGLRSRLTSVYIILREGASIEEFCARHEGEVVSPLVVEPAEMARAGFDRRVRASRLALVVASALTFLCAGLIIVIGMTTAVTERQREMGLLRAVGASRLQIFGAQILVGGIFGTLGAVLGVPIGIGLTAVLVWYFRDLLPAGLDIHEQGLVLAAIGSLGAGLVGALFPAWAASRIPPLQVIARRAAPVRLVHVVACLLAALALIAVHVVALRIEDDEQRFWAYILFALPCMFLGYFLLAVPLLFIVTRVLAPLLTSVLALPRDMLAASVIQTPFRHGATAGTLMVGMAMLVEAWASGVALQQDWLHEIRFADGFAYSSAGLSPEDQSRIGALPFVEDTNSIGRLPVRIMDQQVFGFTDLTPRNAICISFEPRPFFELNSVDWLEGDPETAIPALESGRGMLVAERFLIAKALGVGDSLTLGVGSHEKTFEILGVVSSAGLDLATPLFGIGNAYMELSISCVFIDRNVVASAFDVHDVHIMQIDLADDVSDEVADEAITEAAPGVIFRSGRSILSALQEVADASLAVQSTIAFAALILAAIAVGNVIAANIQARRYEYGVLRAVGARPGVVVRLILAETLLLAVTGAVLGTVFGFELAWMDSVHLQSLAGLPVGVAIPLAPIAIGWAVQITITAIAGLWPARTVYGKQPAELLREKG